MIRTLVSLFILSCFTFPAFAGPSVKTPEGIDFEVQKSALGESQGVKFIVVHFTLTNESDTKKIEFDQRFNYALSDEFGNHYRTLPRPGNYPQPIEKTPSNFPSIYPGESCSKILFFEVPVAKSSTLKLEVNGPGEVLLGPVAIEFPAPRLEILKPAMVEITSPENGEVVSAGDVFQLTVNINTPARPFKLVVVAFGKTMEDSNPLDENNYNINIPVTTPEGQASISVIGYWTDPKNNTQQVLSQNIVIYVNPGPRTSS